MGYWLLFVVFGETFDRAAFPLLFREVFVAEAADALGAFPFVADGGLAGGVCAHEDPGEGDGEKGEVEDDVVHLTPTLSAYAARSSRSTAERNSGSVGWNHSPMLFPSATISGYAA